MKHILPFLIILMAYSCEPKATDYALSCYNESWSHHPVLGDPSFDQFKRYSHNPVQRGTPPFEWPVNGFYFEDPLSGNEYVFAGQYLKNYGLNSAEKALDVTKGVVVFCSKDKGTTWEKRGAAFADESVTLDGEDAPVMIAPDASIVCTDGKYYMGFDYVTRAFSWGKDGIRHSGLAVAVADQPEGPYKILKKSALKSRLFLAHPIFGKYNRCYAGTLLKSGDKWIFLFMLDSGSYFSWALAAVSAPSPEGPWSEPMVLRSVEMSSYYPSLLEYFPAFQYNDTVYAPATSVALNRNFQTISRVALKDVMKPDKWELWKEGSLWHSDNLENEYAGIWGQTFTGFVSKEGVFKVMFPGLDAQKQGTINLASVQWNKMNRDTGFVLAGNDGPAFTSLTGFYKHPQIKSRFNYYGTISFLLNNNAPSGPDNPVSNATLHPLMMTNHNVFQLNDQQWHLLSISPEGKTDTIARGDITKQIYTSLEISNTGLKTAIRLNNILLWEGDLINYNPGHIGLMAMAHSGIEVKSFLVSGKKQSGYTDLLFTDALLNAGSNLKDWEVIKNNPLFTYGIGSISKNDSAIVKWSFTGHGFELYAPKNTGLGRIKIVLNGKVIKETDLFSSKPEKSSCICAINNLLLQKNALIIEGLNGKFAVDCLRVFD